jgi:hypothetical protein
LWLSFLVLHLRKNTPFFLTRQGLSAAEGPEKAGRLSKSHFGWPFKNGIRQIRRQGKSAEQAKEGASQEGAKGQSMFKDA